MAELKPCKCGYRFPVIIGPLLGTEDAFCCKCDDCGYETPVYLHKRAAIDAWNRREK